MARWRRALQLALGLVWLLDAALQCQPTMFGHGFVDGVIAPAAQGNPAPIARPELWAADVISGQPVLWNALFASLQLAIALGLLGLVGQRAVRTALAASIAWALGIWWFGEGLGGILTGAGPIAGAPGPALLYALLALLLWPSGEYGGSVARASIARRWAVGAWVVLCASLGLLALRSGDGELARLRLGVAVGLLLALIALAPVLPDLPARALLALAAGGGVLLWVLGQDFGDILSGESTDPNSGPILALLALAYWPLARSRPWGGEQ